MTFLFRFRGLMFLLLTGSVLCAGAEEKEELWAKEKEAQIFEAIIWKFWDEVREGDALKVARSLPITSFKRARLGEFETLEQGVRLARSGKVMDSLTGDQWLEFLESWEKKGLKIYSTEWHHEGFQKTADGMASSDVRFLVQATTHRPQVRWLVTGILKCRWGELKGGEKIPEVAVELKECEIARKAGPARFRKVWSYEASQRMPNTLPLISHDLDADGLPEIVLPGQNVVAWNRGDDGFEMRPFLARPLPQFDVGLLADVSGDGFVDYLTVARRDGVPLLFVGNEKGEFPNQPMPCAKLMCSSPSSLTAGDIDGDGDLDIWLSQYAPPYNKSGNFPRPYFDAEDGLPSFLLVNQGRGIFKDETLERGFRMHPKRRTYTASLVDVDEDGDLDILTSNDFAGIGCFLNNGLGQFSDAPGALFYDRHLFGMSHQVADLTGDGVLDLFAVGMSSTTARRLDQLGATHPAFPRETKMRPRMAYGNRVYSKNGGRYEKAAFSNELARTGWSWGAAVTDFNLDGDQDVFVVNGHVSGKSAEDYCTHFWRYDIYPDTPAPSERHEAFSRVQTGEISWNGFETNSLFLNQEGKSFHRADFLFGLGHSYDGRAVLSDDFDGDGLPDLLVVQYLSGAGGTPARYKVHLYRNEMRATGQGLTVEVRDGGFNSFRPGVVVTLETTSGKQVKPLITGESFATQHRAVAFFGYGTSRPVGVSVKDQYGNSDRVELTGSEKRVTLTLPRMHPERRSTIQDDHPG